MIKDEFVLWGSAGHAMVLHELISLNGGKVVALFDNDPTAKSCLANVKLHFGVAGFEQWLVSTPKPHLQCCLIAIGGSRGADRLDLQTVLENAGLRTRPVVHVAAHVAASASIGPGSQILANATVAAGAQIGRACIVNHGANVDHECVLEDGVHLAPRATLCGCVYVERCAFVGAGAVVLPRLRIGRGSVVGAGAVVLRDVAPYTTVVGNPAYTVASSLGN